MDQRPGPCHSVRGGQQESGRTLYTIGHAAHPLDELCALLRHHGVQLVVDVRSNPFSRRSPQLCKRPLQRGLQARGIDYRFEGAALGGRLPDEYLGPGGEPDYQRRAAAPDVVEALDRVQALARQRTTALLCGEEDPRRCHRFLLLGRALTARGVEVAHIRADGRVETSAALEREASRQLPLF